MPAIEEQETRLTRHLPSETATAALAQDLAALAHAGDVIALWGDLGAGKTAFARAFINALKTPEGEIIAEEVPSPTFTLVQIYERRPAPVWHFDLYRLEDAEEVWELGLEEALADGIALIEWPERMAGLLPGARLDLALAITGESARVARMTAHGTWRRRLKELGA